ncbi:phosphoglycerate kinase [Leptonema illini]|jgi:phosphoglycerate kinase|uniref:Phosphoglycerate kinase n=1 Tax=Leptonema illini DSM 21528 TaxID=929563 RepID=H2CCS4_9LEPT|nr:phosphoglycerate kinase [Leptonema illini]EHQ05365.1 phosphoglycerate kinase [Leptonema illini DSM 21528]
MKLARIDSQPLRGKRVLLQIELPPPGHPFASYYLNECTETLDLLRERGAHVLITGHPVHTQRPESVSFSAYTDELGRRLKSTLPFFATPEDTKKAVSALEHEPAVMLDNLLHIQGEGGSAKAHVKILAEGIDFFVNEAPGTLADSYSSSVHMPELRPAFAGMRLSERVEALTELQAGKPSPSVFIMGGQDVAASIILLRKNLASMDSLIVGGIVANTALKGNALQMGSSVLDAPRQSDAFQIIERARLEECHVELPIDHMIADRISSKAKLKSSGREVPEGWMSVDVGPKTLSNYEKLLKKAGVVFMHGPLGASDVPEFRAGTIRLLKFLAKSGARVILAGEDLCHIAIENGISFPFLFPDSRSVQRFLSGQELPALAALSPR